MLGAIIGDVVGSVYEFNNIKTKEFPLFSKRSQMIDDSIMTLAVADICQSGDYSKENIVTTIKRWGRAFPNAGYGGHFIRWLFSEDDNPYNSCGNGSAMRVSACGWYGRDEEEVKKLASYVTRVTHNHPEGIKGAEVTAMCIYYARIGKSKEFIKKYVEQYYSLDFDYEELRRTYCHGAEICQVTVPQAIYCFLISTDFEDCLRTTISIGGDCDTTAAISCAIAEAYYKYIPEDIIKELEKRIPSSRRGCDASEIISSFLEQKYEVLTEEEEINDNSIFVFDVEDSSSSSEAKCLHSTSPNVIGEYLDNKYYQIALKKRKESDIYQENEDSVEEIFFQLRNIKDEASLYKGIDKLNDLFAKERISRKVIIKKSLNDAIIYLGETFNIKKDMESYLMNKVYVNKK